MLLSYFKYILVKKNNFLEDFLCQFEISLIYYGKLFKITGFFKNSQIQGFFRFLKHKFLNF